MKALIIVTVLAMATSAIAVPLSRQAKAQALLAAMQDNAEMEGLLRGMLRDGLRLLNGRVVGVQMEDHNMVRNFYNALDNKLRKKEKKEFDLDKENPDNKHKIFQLNDSLSLDPGNDNSS